jgi:hypothetical protein
MHKSIYTVALTVEELAHLIVASRRADTAHFSPATRASLTRARRKLQAAVPAQDPMRYALATAIGDAQAGALDIEAAALRRYDTGRDAADRGARKGEPG